MADAFADLLELIVRDYAITDAQKDIDLNASVDEPAAVIEADKQQIVTDAAERARQLFPSFRTGLLLAFEAQGVGKHEIRARRPRCRAKRHRGCVDRLSGALRLCRIAE